jgi:hypothetical protein
VRLGLQQTKGKTVCIERQRKSECSIMSEACPRRPVLLMNPICGLRSLDLPMRKALSRLICKAACCDWAPLIL